MPEAVVPTDAAIERILAFIKDLLEKAVQNGQVMTTYCELTGGAEIHIYIGPKR